MIFEGVWKEGEGLLEELEGVQGYPSVDLLRRPLPSNWLEGKSYYVYQVLLVCHLSMLFCVFLTLLP